MSDVPKNVEGSKASPLGVGGKVEGNMFYGAHPFIFQRARELRNKMTQAEEFLWHYINNNALGVRFRRQHPISIYIADFYCHPLKLIIELDGGIHQLEDVKKNDEVRQNNLKDLGLIVIRFTNEQVLSSLEKVLEKIKDQIILIQTNQKENFT
ncbi:endonuclease domain-containing protein [Chitinophagaceae bacterium LWZ2-11]